MKTGWTRTEILDLDMTRLAFYLEEISKMVMPKE